MHDFCFDLPVSRKSVGASCAFLAPFVVMGRIRRWNDRCTAGMEWITVQVNGRRPARRFGHSMVALTSGSSENYGKLAVFGGTSGALLLFMVMVSD